MKTPETEAVTTESKPAKPTKRGGASGPALPSEPGGEALSPKFCYVEAALPARLGVARGRLRAVRLAALTEGVDWQAGARGIMLSAAGVQKLRAAVAPAGTRLAADAEAELAPPGRAPRMRLRVVRVCANARMLDCVAATVAVADENRAERLLGRVKDNANFQRGMEFEAIFCAGRMWQYLGRLPRRKGMW